MSDLLSLIHSPGKEYMCVVGIRLCMYVYSYKTGLYDDRHLKIGIFIFSRYTWMNHRVFVCVCVHIFSCLTNSYLEVSKHIKNLSQLNWSLIRHDMPWLMSFTSTT